MDKIKMFGELGFVFVEDIEFGFNFCVEIGMCGYMQDGCLGFQFCNLIEMNGGKCIDLFILLCVFKVVVILGMFQVVYIDFVYFDDVICEIIEWEVLFGCFIIGWMSNLDVLFNDDNMCQVVFVIVEINEMVVGFININLVVCMIVVKLFGNVSVLLGCVFGIYGEYVLCYLCNVQMNCNEEVVQLMKEKNFVMVV